VTASRHFPRLRRLRGDLLAAFGARRDLGLEFALAREIVLREAAGLAVVVLVCFVVFAHDPSAYLRS
jgi:hypothetical protein